MSGVALAETRLAVVELGDRTALLSTQDREDLRRYLGSQISSLTGWALASDAELSRAVGTLPGGRPLLARDEAALFTVGRALPVEKAVAAEVVAKDQECAVSATLYDVSLAAKERTALVRGECGLDALYYLVSRAASALAGADAGSAAAPSAASVPSLDSPRLGLAGNHVFGGFAVAPGLMAARGGPYGSLNIAFRGGVLLARNELLLEISPVTSWYALEAPSQLTVNAAYGRYIALTPDLFYVLRGGFGLVAVNISEAALQLRADPIGAALQMGRVLFEVDFPSIRANFLFDSGDQFVALLFTASLTILSNEL
ncbi:MAG: hypothetical protein IT384_18170 [Deltaproteobacteria bacterium]|nr:hypothetical protein [Deltaproteobacteria bacterium]